MAANTNQLAVGSLLVILSIIGIGVNLYMTGIFAPAAFFGGLWSAFSTFNFMMFGQSLFSNLAIPTILVFIGGVGFIAVVTSRGK